MVSVGPYSDRFGCALFLRTLLCIVGMHGLQVRSQRVRDLESLGIPPPARSAWSHTRDTDRPGYLTVDKRRQREGEAVEGPFGIVGTQFLSIEDTRRFCLFTSRLIRVTSAQESPAEAVLQNGTNRRCASGRADGRGGEGDGDACIKKYVLNTFRQRGCEW